MVVLANSRSAKACQLKDKILNMILSNINQGKFEIKRGNTLASFAQAININYSLYFGNSEDIVFDCYRNEKLQSTGNELFSFNSGAFLFVMYHRLLKASNNFIPYLQEYFPKYKPSQKLVVLRMLQRLNIHDDVLYTNFVNDISSLLAKYSDEDLVSRLQQICLTQHPITNNIIDRTFEMLDVIDFHYGISGVI